MSVKRNWGGSCLSNLFPGVSRTVLEVMGVGVGVFEL